VTLSSSFNHTCYTAPQHLHKCKHGLGLASKLVGRQLLEATCHEHMHDPRE